MTEAQGNILIVDDDFSIRRVLCATLGGLGFTMEEACNGEGALALVKAKPFNAVMLDINMHGIGGMETCRELRRMVPMLPILMLTVKDSQDDIVTALGAGADDYITKPFHIRELIARLKAAVRRIQALGGTVKTFCVVIWNSIRAGERLKRAVKRCV